MMLPKPNSTGALVLAAGFLFFTRTDRALSQGAPEKAQALLQKVKQGEVDRRIALKQTEIDRLKEDLDKSKKDMEALQKNFDATGGLITESSANLDQLAAERKRLESSLDLAETRIDAERRKIEGLKSLSAAQSVALEALNQQTTEIDTRSRVREAEMQLLTQGKPVPGEDNDENGSAELVKLKKTLASNENKTATAERAARKAMKAATARLELADEAEARVKRMAEGTKNEGLEPVAEKTGDAAPGGTAKAAPAPKDSAAKH